MNYLKWLLKYTKQVLNYYILIISFGIFVTVAMLVGEKIDLFQGIIMGVFGFIGLTNLFYEITNIYRDG